jgi:hypothetical protein
MGKIILEFDSIDENEDALVAMQAMDWYSTIFDLDQFLRGITKHETFENRQAKKKEVEMAEKIRAELRKILNNYNLTL